MSGSVVAFPNTARVGSETKGEAVVVAPRGAVTVAWVRTAKGWAILEETPSWQHAVADGRAYAARFEIPFRFQSTPLDPKSYTPEPERGGEITIEPSERHGGSWDVVHFSRSGDSAAILSNTFAFDGAIAEARRLAKKMGASFDEHAPPGTPLAG